MRIRKSFQGAQFATAQADLVFNILIIFVFLTTMLAVIAKKTKEEKSPRKPQQLVMPLNAGLTFTIKWPNGPEDIDLWVIGPDGAAAGYKNPRTNMLGYLRDDTGRDKAGMNYELVSALGIVPGHYVMNINFFSSNGGKTRVTVECQVLIRVKKKIVEVYRGSVTLNNVNEEKTVIQFDINERREIIRGSISHEYESAFPAIP